MAHASTVVFRVDAGPEIGFGHLARALVLAEALRDHGVAVHFYPSSTHDEILSLLEQGGFATSVHSGSTPQQWLSETRANAVVYDLVHTCWRAEQDGLFAEIADVGNAAVPIVFFDGYGEQSYRCQAGAPTVDFIVAPYVGEPGPCRILAGRILAGPQYFPLARSYRNATRRGERSAVERILVTCGGADPYMAAPGILEALLSMPERDIQIDMVMGALFSDENKRQIGAIAAHAPDKVHLVDAPRSLAAQMGSADLCVCANGLTKYELAAMGMPTIAVSLSPAHHRANLAFAESGALMVLGLLDDVDDRTIADAVSEMIGEADLRARMSRAGVALVDGKGTDRILKEVKLIPC